MSVCIREREEKERADRILQSSSLLLLLEEQAGVVTSSFLPLFSACVFILGKYHKHFSRSRLVGSSTSSPVNRCM